MSSLYPNYLDKFIDKHNETGDGQGDHVLAEDINLIQDALAAVQNTLGVNPQGNAINIASRLYGLEQTQSMSAPRVTLYKGNPLNVNGATNAEAAARYFAYFDHVIFTDVNIYTDEIINTRDVIEKTKACSGTKFYAQVDAGVATSGHSIADITIIADKWVEVGIDGLYFNNFGYDVGVSRERQNAILSIAHNRDLHAIVNATNYEDIFGRANTMGMNPDNIETELEADDAVLYIGFAINGSTYQSLSGVAGLQSLVNYRTKYGTKIFALAIINDTEAIEAHKKYYYGQALAILYSLDAFHAIKAGAVGTADIYPTLPIVGAYYDAKPIITQNGTAFKRDAKIGKIVVDIATHTYSFEDVKIPLRFIDFDSDDTKISADKVEGLAIDVIAEINNYAGPIKINPSKIEFNTTEAAEAIVESINLISGQSSPKIDSNVVSGLSVDHIKAVVVEALEDNLGALLESGQYDANLRNVTARWISALNAYFNNIIAENAEIEGLNAGVINAGQIDVKILGANTITSDKLTIHANHGLNKWSGTIVLKPNGSAIESPTRAMITGKDVFRRTEAVDNSAIVTSNIIGTGLTNYLVMWETFIYCTEPITISKQLQATSPTSIYVNDFLIANANSFNTFRANYSVVLNGGWNKFTVIQDHSSQPECAFDLGIKFSDMALGTENGKSPTAIARVDAYAEKVTAISGDLIKTGTIEVGHLRADVLSADNIKSGTIQASTSIQIGSAVVMNGADGIIVDGPQGAKGIEIREGIMQVTEDGEARVKVGQYDDNKYGIEIITKDGLEQGYSIVLDKDGLRNTSGNFSINADGTVDIIGSITATEGKFTSKIGVGDDAASAGIIIDGSDPSNPEIYVRVVEEDLTANPPIKAGYLKINQSGVQVSEDGTSWITKLHAGGLTVGGTDIGNGVIRTEKLDVENVKAGLVEAGIIKAMEAYISKLVATEGDFERLMADIISGSFINANNISLTSQARDINSGTGILTIDNGGMLVSSKPKAINLTVDETLAVVNPVVDPAFPSYRAVNVDWLMSTTDVPIIKLMNKSTSAIVADIPTSLKWYSVDYKNGIVTVDAALLQSELGIAMADYNIVADYKWHEINWPTDANLVKIDRSGIWISANGGQSWTSKLTGGGIRITSSAEINEAIITTAHIGDAQITNAKISDLEAGKIEAGTIDLSKGINIESQDGYVNLGYVGLTVQDHLTTPQKMVKVDKDGISISGNGGGSWTSKLTGDGLVVTSAEIVNLTADKIATGTLSAANTITVGNGVKISGATGILVDGSVNAGIEIKEGKLQVTEGTDPRVVLGEYASDAYGLQILTSGNSITLNKNGLFTANNKFKIKVDGTIEAVDGTFTGTISSKTGSFGDTNKILVDEEGLVLNTGSIVDTRTLANQKLRIDANGIIAKQGYIGGLEINSAIAGLSAKIDILGEEVEQFKITPDSMTLSGNEALVINTGNAVVKEDGKTYVMMGKLGPSQYGIKINLVGDDGELNGNYIRLNQNGLTAWNGTKNTIDIDKDGDVTITGTINATAGKLSTLSVDGTITIGTGGKIVAGSTELTPTGITANQGTIGGWTVDSQKISKGSTEINSNLEQIKTTGVIIGKYDGTNYGIQATAGKIAGWDLAANSISKTTVVDAQNSKSIIINSATPSITLTGKVANVTKTITLDGSNGKLTADNVDLNGGKIAGWIIDAGAIKNNAVNNNATILIDSANSLIRAGSLTANATLSSTGLNIIGGAISITTNSDANGSLKLDSNGLLATVLTANMTETENITGLAANTSFVKLDKSGLRIGQTDAAGAITYKAAITGKGIYGQLLTDQSVSGTKFDLIKPKAPTGVTLTALPVEVLATGQFVNMQVTWTAPTQNEDNSVYNDAGGFKIYMQVGGGGPFVPEAIVAADQTSYVARGVKPNTIYTIKVTAFDKTGNESLAAMSSAVTSAKDTQAPDKITGLSVVDGLLAFTLKWTKPIGANNLDIDYFEIQSSVNATEVWNTIGKVYTDFITVRGLDYATDYSFRVRGVDTSGNLGTWSDVLVAGKPSQIGKEDIVAGTITAEELNIGSVVKSINAQQTTLFHFDGTLQSTQGLQPYVEVVNGEKVVHQAGFFKKEARFGASVSIEEDTENIIATVTGGNASLKSNTGGWFITDAVYVPVNGVEGVDDGYLEVPYSWDNGVNNIPVVEGDLTLSVYAKSVDANSKVRIDVTPLDGNMTVWSNYAAANGLTWQSSLKSIISSSTTLDWKRYIKSIKVPAGSGTTKIKVFVLQSSGAGKVAIDNLQVEQRAYATSFVNGVKTEGYVDYYAPAIMKRDEGTISFWMKNIIGWKNVTNNNHADTPYQDNLFIWGKPVDAVSATANSIYAKYRRDTRTLSVQYNGTWLNYILPIDTPDDEWLHFAFSWKASEQKLYINGSPVATTTVAVIAEPEDKLFRLGYIPRLSGGNIVEEYVPEGAPGEKKARASCLFDELRIDKKVIDADEIKSWYLQESSFYDASAQIDADSQNISAAAASVTINNEGITVRDGKMHVIGQDGQTLITGGRLQVNGLDVGIAQSDNGIYNGNFTIGDTLYGPGDVHQSQKGIESWGAKYWRSRRSSGPSEYYVKNSLSWNRIWFTQYVGANTVKQAYEDQIRPQVIAAFQKTMNVWVRETVHAELVKINPAATAYELTNTKQAGADAIDQYIDNTAFNTTTYITNQLTPLGLAPYIPLVAAVVDGFKPRAVLTPEYNVGMQVRVNAPGTPEPIVSICQTAGRNAFNAYCADYDADTNLVVQNELSTTLPAAGITNPIQIAGFVAIVQQTIAAMQVPTKQSQETTINDSISNSFEMLNNWNCGYVTWNDINGIRQFKVLHIMYPDEVADYQMWHPDGNWIAGEMYEVTSPIVKDLIFGWPGVINIPENIDFVTGLPFISKHPYESGGTEYFVNVFGHYLGRVGYAELGVKGPNAEENIIEQDTSKLIVYTDGFKPNGTHYKQHTISFNAIWEKDKEGEIVKADSGKLEFEVEEIIPKYSVNPDGTANVLPSYVFNGLPTEADYNSSPTVAYWRALLGDPVFLNPALVTLEDKLLMHNSTMMADNATPQQIMEVGNISYPNTNPSSYTVNSTKNINTIMTWLLAGGTNGITYTHPLFGKTGKIYNKTCYYNIPDGATTEEINAIIARDTCQLSQYNVVEATNPDPDGNETVLRVSRKGDYVSIAFSSYSEVDAISTVFQNPQSGVYDAYIDGKHYTSGSVINTTPIFENTELSGIPAGSHAIMFVSRHSITGIDDAGSTPFNVSMGQIRIYDWYNIKDVIPMIPDGVVPPADKLALINRIATENKLEFTSEDAGLWTRMSIAPKIVNSKTSSGTPVFPERLPVKYKVRVKLTKDASDALETAVKVTGIQAELGTNPSYARTVYGDESIPGAWVQSYNKELWLQSGIKTRHLEEHIAGFQRETGVYGRHIAEGTITSTKIAFSSITDSHIADANITFRKTRTRKSKLTQTVLSLNSYELEYGTDLFDNYVCFLPQTPTAGVFYLPFAVEYESEDLFENGQLLIPGEDYTIHKRLALVKADDMWEVARILGETSSNPVLQPIANETTSRELTTTEIQALGIELISVDAYTTAIGERLKSDDVQLEYATQIILATAPDVTDTYVIKYWQEI